MWTRGDRLGEGSPRLAGHGTLAPCQTTACSVTTHVRKVRGDRRQDRSRLERRELPDPAHHRQQDRQDAEVSAHLRCRWQELRDRGLEGRRTGESRVVRQPGEASRRRDPGARQGDRGAGAHRDGRGQGPRVAHHAEAVAMRTTSTSAGRRATFRWSSSAPVDGRPTASRAGPRRAIVRPWPPATPISPPCCPTPAART